MITERAINAAHDCADGGLFVSLVEMGMNGNYGCSISTSKEIRKDAFLFGESQGRVVVSLKRDNIDSLKSICQNHQVPFYHLGQVRENTEVVIDDEKFDNIENYKNYSENVINP